MIVNPGIRRFLGSAIQRLFNSASVSLPLTHTAIPTRGSITPSFTRATTETGQKWDEAGYLDFTALAGEMVFKGARRVRNLLTFTEDIGNAAWTKRETTYSGGRLIEAATTADHSVWQAASTTAGSYYVASGYAKADQNSVIQITFSSGQVSGDPKANFNLSTGALGTVDAGLTAEIEAAPDIGAGYYRFSVKAQAAATSLTAFFAMVPLPTSVRLANYAGNVSNGLYLNKMQIEDVTGQTTQTASEYVSVGVPSDWAGDDLVTNGTFDSTTTGWTGSTATLSVASGALRVTATGDYGFAYQAITTVVGTRYVLAVDIIVGTGALFLVRVGTTIGGFDNYDSGFVATATQKLIVNFTATATTTYVNLFGHVTGTYTDFDNISVKPATYHGSMVDGVKCYDTDRSGNPISTSGSYPLVGYVPWEARTNLLLQSAVVATQSITVAAVAHTLSFKGTGTITLSGVSAAGPLVGTGANDRVTLTFTPTAGSLTLTVSGSCTVGQLEAGSFATPYIPTTTVAVARNSDVLTYTGAQISSLSAFTLYMEAASAASADVVGISSSSAATRLPLYGGLSGTKLRMYDGTNDVQSANWARPSTTKAKLVTSFDGTATGKGYVNGGAVGSGTFAALTWNVLGIGCNPLTGASQMNGPATNVRVWARGLSNSELQAITS